MNEPKCSCPANQHKRCYVCQGEVEQRRALAVARRNRLRLSMTGDELLAVIDDCTPEEIATFSEQLLGAVKERRHAA